MHEYSCRQKILPVFLLVCIDWYTHLIITTHVYHCSAVYKNLARKAIRPNTRAQREKRCDKDEAKKIVITTEIFLWKLSAENRTSSSEGYHDKVSSVLRSSRKKRSRDVKRNRDMEGSLSLFTALNIPHFRKILMVNVLEEWRTSFMAMSTAVTNMWTSKLSILDFMHWRIGTSEMNCFDPLVALKVT